MATRNKHTRAPSLSWLRTGTSITALATQQVF